ncbi:hypothetical protein ANCCAN_13270 [Ancylostoma caninum]|uniref:Uncharacterized protein n=1 Tax=Ancylostoma caninum TaxID=29170 RepID=A0A368GCN8_ANCCA|nr:hypothetical protein ANCCAN_13270 [Ancylostoma caninum]
MITSMDEVDSIVKLHLAPITATTSPDDGDELLTKWSYSSF